jgi:excisionase family DNA binding protein
MMTLITTLHIMAGMKAKQMTVKEYAESIGVTRATVQNWVQRGKIKAKRVTDGPMMYYLITAGTPRPNLKPGPVPKLAAKKRK